MRPSFAALLVLLAAALTRAYAAEEKKAETPPVVVVYDFTSGFDGGDAGRLVAQNILAKLDRSRKCTLILPTDMAEIVREAKFVAGFDDKPAGIMKFTAEKLAATHAIWGKVEKVGDEGLRVSARAAAVADDGRKLIVDAAIDVKNLGEVQLATNEIVRLFFDIAVSPPRIGPDEEKQWLVAPNLVKNPSFESGKDHPDNWDTLDKSYHQGCVTWVDSPDGKGKCIKFTLNEAVAAGPGAAYYSAPISIKDGKVYRMSVRVRADGPSVKVFMKHYKFIPPGPNEKEGQWRETRRAHMNCETKRGEWVTCTLDFSPHRDDEFDPEITRVELYAYWPKGTVYFDDVVLKKLK